MPSIFMPVPTVKTYAAPDHQYESADYSVEVEGKSAWVYQMAGNHHIVKFDSDFKGPVTVDVHPDEIPIESLEFAPYIPGVELNSIGRLVRIKIPQVGRYELIVDGDKGHSLMIAANPMLVGAPTRDDVGLKYYGPGVYTQDLILPKDQSIFVDGGALLMSGIQVGSASPTGARLKGARVGGRGIVDSTLRLGSNAGRAFRAYNLDQLLLEGLTFINVVHYGGAVYQSVGVQADLCDMFSYQLNGVGTPDGWDHIASKNCSFRRGLVLAYDDGFSMKWYKNGYSGDCQDIYIGDTVIIQGDAGNAIECGHEVGTTLAGVIANIVFENLHILRKTARSTDTNRRAAVGIHNTGPGPIRNVLYRNVNVDSAQENVVFITNEFYGDYPSKVRGEVSGIRFEDCNFPENPGIIIKGTSDKPIGDVVFMNCSRGWDLLKPEHAVRTFAPSVIAA